uniref:RING-type domain-containing protein n=1 Tax=Steinernema glaseri TaxID=37863 RepID=A0A1I7ZCL1_9BILA
MTAKINYRLEGDRVFYIYKVTWEEDCNKKDLGETPTSQSTDLECESIKTKSSKKKRKARKEKKRNKKEKAKEDTSKNTEAIYGTGFDYEEAFKDCTKMCSSQSLCKNRNSRGFTDSQLEDLKKKAPRPSNSVLKNGRCDGPCKKMRPIQELHLIGLCEHAICDTCMEDAPYIDNNYGGSGCPNQKCYLTDVAAICPDPERRHRKFQRLLGLPVSYRHPQEESTSFSTSYSSSMSSSRRSGHVPITRLILVKVFLYERDEESKKKKLRLLHSLELPSHVNLEKACEFVVNEVGAFPLKKVKKRTFIAKNGMSNSSDWFRVERSHWDQPIDDFCAMNETVSVIFDVTK